MPYTAFLNHTQRLTHSALRKAKALCIIISRYGIESCCVGAAIACAGYGEFQLPIAAVLFLFLPITTLLVLSACSISMIVEVT